VWPNDIKTAAIIFPLRSEKTAVAGK